MIESIEPAMVAILRSKRPEERLAMAFAMWKSARDMARRAVADQHPEWPEDRVAAEVARRLAHDPP